MSVGGRWREEVGQKLNAVLKKASAGAKIVASLPRGKGCCAAGQTNNNKTKAHPATFPRHCEIGTDVIEQFNGR